MTVCGLCASGRASSKPAAWFADVVDAAQALAVIANPSKQARAGMLLVRPNITLFIVNPPICAPHHTVAKVRENALLTYRLETGPKLEA